ncbi:MULTISPECIES: L-lactate permease [Burkholderiaceae]|jgi:lactate permease|uniref:L-lactate permease n=1 Tax=Caballeronia sordidicola TaxID=196367 RepID=A0A242MF18_CABSO|nr:MULTISPECIES: L-lactate permease [Burkholderiaceae]AMM13533.1 lactate permease [Burkholderia sp. PAMC 28687]OTP69885.1 L-lactate permease [Caballeronia sordidicola]
MFHQILTPVSGSLGWSFLVAALPIIVVLVLLGWARRPAWQASLAGLVVGIVIAIGVWHFPVGLALDSVAAGAVFAVWPVMWIVFAAILLYNIAQRSGRFEAFRMWMIDNLPNDRRIVLVVIGFSFGALLEGISGFGTPIAITSSLLILLGFPTLEALTFTLIFNTAPVAFGALGVPITVLGAVTHLPTDALAKMVGRQLPFFALMLPFYVIGVYAGFRNMLKIWPVLLVAGGTFALTQFVTSNFISYSLTDVLSSLVSLILTIAFLRVWKPAPDERFAVNVDRVAQTRGKLSGGHGWVPWIVVSVVVIVWTVAKIFMIGDVKVAWPGLDKAVFITLYNQPYAAIWDFQPLATGTAILVAAIITALIVKLPAREFGASIADTWIQTRIAIMTVATIVGLAYLMNYSGMNYTLGLGVASVGAFFPLVSAFLGWVAVFLSGSDTSGNALFGNLQVVAARQLNLNPILMAATNSSGGVMGKMISPQNISTGVATTGLKGKEGVVFAKTFKHSILLTVLLGVLVWLQQNVLTWMIPH